MTVYSRARVLVGIVLSAFLGMAHAQHVVRLQFEYQAAMQNVDIELFPDITPQTVANFLDYVTNGSYDDTFIYRSIPGFVLQSGGYTFRPADPVNQALRPIDEGTGLARVAEGVLSPVVNEFNVSNTRGTVAMAKLPGQPDSATNEWFVNLVDNSASLDAQNGGFTVFGEVIDDGMQVMDEIASLPKHLFVQNLLGSAFSDMPVTGEIFGAIYRSDMVMINSMSLISRPVLRGAPTSTDFFLDVAADASANQAILTLVNRGDVSLTLGSILPPVDNQFTIVSDSCSSVTLEPLQNVPTAACTMLLQFEAAAVGDFTSILVIPYTNQVATESFLLSYPLAGAGVPATPVLVADVASIYFDEVVVGETAERQITLQNRGGADLTITGYSFNGTNAAQYSIVSGCDQGTVLSMGQSCELGVKVVSAGTGLLTANLEIQSSSDPVSVALSVVAVEPTISVVPSIELAAQVGQSASFVEAITNTGTGALVVSNISIAGSDAALFSQINNCPGVNNSGVADAPLGEGQSCAFRIDYMPDSDGTHIATLIIETNDPKTPVLNVPITGHTGAPAINVVSSFLVGTAQVNGVSAVNRLEIKNDGSAPLHITALNGFSINGLTQTNNCITAPVESGNKCYVDIEFSSSQIGQWNYPVSIESDDPQNASVQVNLVVAAEYDADGIDAAEENGAPNSGDGNNDGVADASQNNVVSFSVNGNIVTIVADKSLNLKGDTIIRNLDKDAFPRASIREGFDLRFGVQSFVISIPAGDAVDVGIILPETTSPESFYLNDAPSESQGANWYRFVYDSEFNTGILVNSRVKIENPTDGKIIERSMIIARFVDGRRGDADLAVDGKITVNAASVVFVKENDAGGVMSLLFLCVIGLLRICMCQSGREYINQ